MTKMTTIPENYNNIRAEIVELLKTARSTAARNVNSIMTAVYWEIGRRGDFARASLAEMISPCHFAIAPRRLWPRFRVSAFEFGGVRLRITFQSYRRSTVLLHHSPVLTVLSCGQSTEDLPQRPVVR